MTELRLDFSIKLEQMRQYFSRYGPIQRSSVVVDRLTGKSRGFGFVSFGLFLCLSR